MIKTTEIVDFLLSVDPYSGGVVEQTERKLLGVETLLRAMYDALPEEQKEAVRDAALRAYK